MIVSGVPRGNLTMSSAFRDHVLKDNVTLCEVARTTTCSSVGVRMITSWRAVNEFAPGLDTHYDMHDKIWMGKCKQ